MEKARFILPNHIGGRLRGQAVYREYSARIVDDEARGCDATNVTVQFFAVGVERSLEACKIGVGKRLSGSECF
jgi:hypothetical protein